MLIGAGVIGLGIYLYRKNKAGQVIAAPVQEVKADVSQIQMPIASDTVAITLPATLLEPFGNAGIVPPAASKAATPVPVLAPATPVSVIQSQPSSMPAQTKASTILPAKNTGGASTPARVAFKGLAGLGNAYLLN